MNAADHDERVLQELFLAVDVDASFRQFVEVVAFLNGRASSNARRWLEAHPEEEGQ